MAGIDHNGLEMTDVSRVGEKERIPFHAPPSTAEHVPDVRYNPLLSAWFGAPHCIAARGKSRRGNPARGPAFPSRPPSRHPAAFCSAFGPRRVPTRGTPTK